MTLSTQRACALLTLVAAFGCSSEGGQGDPGGSGADSSTAQDASIDAGGLLDGGGTATDVASSSSSGGVSDTATSSSSGGVSDTATSSSSGGATDTATSSSSGASDTATSSSSGAQDVASSSGAVQDAGAASSGGGADGAGSSGGADGAGSSSGADATGTLVEPTVELKESNGSWECAITKDAPAAGVDVTYQWRVNSGKWADGKQTWDELLKDCDLLECTVTAKAADQTVTSKPASHQAPVGDGCKTGNACTAPTCAKEGGCSSEQASAACEDGDECTIGDVCAAGVCKAGEKKTCVTYYSDADGDGFGATELGCKCVAPDKSATEKGDCDDNNKDVNPKATETCDGLDEDCNGQTDEQACTGVFPPGTTGYKPDKPTSGDSYETTATATFDAGPFGPVTLKGTVKKAGKDAPVTWCFSGPAKLIDAAPLASEGATIEICKDDKGVITRTWKGDVVLEGDKGAAQGTFSSGKAAALKGDAKALKVLGLAGKDVNFSWKKGDKHLAIAKGNAVIDYLGQGVAMVFSGQLVPSADATLALQVAKPDVILTIGGVAKATSQTAAGKRIRKGKTLSTTLDLGAQALKLSAAEPGKWSVKAERLDGKKWQLAIAADDTKVAPFSGLSLKGDFTEGAKTACVKGKAPVKVDGAVSNLDVQVCWTDGKGSVTFATTAIAKPTGTVKLTGTFKDGKLCLSGAPSVTVPSSDQGGAKIAVQTCYDAGKSAFSPHAFSADAKLPGGAVVALSGVTDAKTGKLCLDGTTKTASALFPLKGVTFLAASASSCFGDTAFSNIALTFTYRVGKAGDKASVVLQSQLDLGEAGGVCVSKAKDAKACADADDAWRKIAADPGERFLGRYSWRGGACVDLSALTKKDCGTQQTWKSGGPARAVTTLAKACEGKETACNSADWQPFWNMPIGAPYDLRSGVFTKLQAAVWIHGGKASLRLQAPLTSKLDGGVAKIVTSGTTTLLGLKSAEIFAHIDESGAHTAKIMGRTDLNLLGKDIAKINVKGLLIGAPGKDRIDFTGVTLPASCNASKTTCDWPSVQPFKAILGDGVFESTGKGGVIEVQAPYNTAKTVPLEVTTFAKASLKLPQGQKQSVEATMYVEFRRGEQSGKLLTLPVITFAVPVAKHQMAIGKFTIKLGEARNKLGKVETRPTVFVASSEGTKTLKLDLDGDKTNGRETTWEVNAGGLVRSTAILTPFADLFENPTATVDLSWVGIGKFRLVGKLDLNWTLIKPEYGVPTLKKLVLTDVFARIDFPGTIRFFTGGHADLTVIDRKKKEQVLKGTAQFEADKSGAMGGTVALSGLWKNPFWIPNVAIFNTGLSLKWIPGAPAPNAFGYTGQALLLKEKIDADWPEIKGNEKNFPVGVNKDGTLMQKLPGNVFTYGASLYFDLLPSKSGFCYVPAVCLKMPTLLYRLDVQNIGTDDIADLVNLAIGGFGMLVDEAKTMRYYDVKTKKWVETKSPLKPLLDFIPTGKGLPKADFGPISATLDRFQVYMHTHNDEHFGIDWPFGFKLMGDARFKVPAGKEKGQEKKIKLRGDLDIWGATLQGWISPMQFVAGVNLTGDPFRRYAQTGDGTLRVQAENKHHNWGTFEGWFTTGDKVHALPYQTTTYNPSLYQRIDSKGNGVRIAIDETAAPCEEGAIDLDGNKLDCKTPGGRLVITLQTNDAKIPQKARKRVLKTHFGVFKPNTTYHVAVVRDPKSHGVTVYIDGAEPRLLDSAWGADGKPGTGDDLATFALPAINSTIWMGNGFDHVDDLRLWTEPRKQSEINRWSRKLEKGYHLDKTLIARWEVDYDNPLDKEGGNAVMRNSRLDVSDTWHGRYINAKSVIDPANQNLWFRYDWPIKNPLHSGWGIKAGLDLKLPKSFRELSGNPEGVAFAVDLNYNAAKVGGKVYARELTLVPIPKKGGFIIGGDGPDGRPKTWDDGLFAELEMRYPTAGKFTGEAMPMLDATGRLAFEWEDKRQQILGMVFRMGCLKKDDKVGAVFSPNPCKLLDGYHIYAKTVLGKDGELAVDLGKDLGKLGLTGIFELSTLDAPVKLLMQGGFTVFGRKVVDVLVKLDDSGFLATGELNLSKIQGVDLGVAAKLEISYDWNPARLCAAGKTKVKIPVLATFDGDVKVCLGTNPVASFEGTAKAGKFGVFTLADVAVKLHTSKGLEITKAKLKIPEVFDGKVTGFYKGADDFDLTGKVETKLGTGKLLAFDMSANLTRAPKDPGASMALEGKLKAANKWITGAIKGGAEFNKGNWYYALAGDATLKPLGFTMAQGRGWLCKPYDKKAKSTPEECKTKSGLGMSGKIDIGIATIKIEGGIDTGVKVKDKGKTYTVDRLYLNGKLDVNLHKVFKYTGDLKMYTTEPFVGGSNYLNVSGTVKSFGLSKSYSTKLESGNDGLPKPYELKAAGTLTPFSGWSLASGDALFKYEKPGKTTMSAGGSLDLSPVLKGQTSATINTSGSGTWTGKGKINLATLLVADLGWTLSTKGTAFDGNFKADTKIVTLGVDIAGTIPKDLKFAFSGKGWVRLYPFPKSDFAEFNVSYVDGFLGKATLDLKVIKMVTTFSAANKGTGIGVSGAATLSTWKIGTFVFKWIEEITKTAKKAISGCKCSACGGCWGGLPGVRCKCKETKSTNSAVEASVTFALSGTSYKDSSNVTLKATAKLKAGKWGGSSTTSCELDSTPQCCFTFVSPIGKQCLKLY